jgi:uncharacterized protein involved in exopolysaccharide biosynthesis
MEWQMSSFRPRTLSEYIQAARRRKFVIAVPALVVIIASFLAIKRLPNLYESSIFIVIEPDAPQGRDQESADIRGRLVTVRQQLLSRARLERLIAKHGLYRDMSERGVPLDRIIEKMRADMDAEVNSTRPDITDAFRIYYRAPAPETARLVVTDLAEELVAENLNAIRSQLDSESEVLRKRVQEMASELSRLESQHRWLIGLRDDAPSLRSQAPVQSAGAQKIALGGLEDQQYKLQQQIADLDQRIAEQRRVVEEQKKGVPRDNPGYSALIARRAELRFERDKLIRDQGLTEKHPRVAQLDSQIAAVEAAIAELKRQEVVAQTPEERELRALESERNRLKVELEVAARALKRQRTIPIVSAAPEPEPRDAASASLARYYFGLKQSYKELIAKLRDVELRREKLGSGSRLFRIVDPASLPLSPIWPNRRILALVAVGLGLMVGIGFGVLAELRNFTKLHTAEDVEYYARLPLLASVPRALLPGQLERQRRKVIVKAALGLVAAAASTFVLSEALMAIRFFEMLSIK